MLIIRAMALILNHYYKDAWTTILTGLRSWSFKKSYLI